MRQVIDYEPPLEQLGQKGYRKKRKTRVEREFCKYTEGKKNKCRNAWHYENAIKPKKEAQKLS